MLPHNPVTFWIRLQRYKKKDEPNNLEIFSNDITKVLLYPSPSKQTSSIPPFQLRSHPCYTLFNNSPYLRTLFPHLHTYFMLLHAFWKNLHEFRARIHEFRARGASPRLSAPKFDFCLISSRLSRDKVNFSLHSLLPIWLSSYFVATQQRQSKLFSAFAAPKFGHSK